jgi:hypothetical protein
MSLPIPNPYCSAALTDPKHFSIPAPWAGHIPFAQWLISVHKPNKFVELGAYSGISYLAFCQAILEYKTGTRAFAVDTWKGDEHAGYYSERIYKTLREAHDPYYADFSSLLRMSFDEAVARFDDHSIDLLHIDGLHTYEAVKHDFETWLPKLSARGIVIFHDTDVYRDDFGVYRLWDEIRLRYPSFRFHHSNGLGVVLVGPEQNDVILKTANDAESSALAKRTFQVLGQRFELQAELQHVNQWLREANEKIDLQKQSVDKQHHWIVQQDQKILELERNHNHVRAAVDKQHEWIVQQDANLLEVERLHIQIKNELQGKLGAAGQFNNELQNKLEVAAQAQQTTQLALINRDQEIKRLISTNQELLTSTSWKLTRPVRALGGWGRRAIGLTKNEQSTSKFPKSTKLLRQTSKAARYIARGEFGALAKRIRSVKREESFAALQSGMGKHPGVLHWGVMATPHTLFMAHLIADGLRKQGWSVDVLTSAPKEFNHDWYFVICPQMFDVLPPGEKRIVYQLEQSVSSRWFTQAYCETLENSFAMLDYALVNIEFLTAKGIAYPHVNYLPVGASQTYGVEIPHEQKLYDVLFYGDSQSSPRRRKLLDALKKQFNVKIAEEMFGADMQRMIKQSRLVINLHYYEDALLEPRIQECLSLGVPVVSETARDVADYPELAGAVRFFAVDSIDEMVATVRETLATPPTAERINTSVELSAKRFNFMFQRFLIGLGFLPASVAYQLDLNLPNGSDQFALSMPETIERRNTFLGCRPKGYVVFDGLRRRPGWIGCALSYAALANHALKQGLTQLTVMEDDVLLPVDFDARLTIVHEFLAQRPGQWDIFSGVMASLHADIKVLAVEQYKGVTFLTVDRVMSMVFNIYGTRAINHLATWDADNHNAETNTIDRHLERQASLRVVVAVPFLVGHREELLSTLWGFQNTQYRKMIADSELALQGMATSAVAAVAA